MGILEEHYDRISRLLEETSKETERQVKKWGIQSWPDGTKVEGDDIRAKRAKDICDALAEKGLVTWRDILFEEVMEAFDESDPDALLEEVIQCAAVCMSWASDIAWKKSQGLYS